MFNVALPALIPERTAVSNARIAETLYLGHGSE